MCKRSVSEITSFNLTVDLRLPDILPVGELTADRWINVSLDAQDKSDTKDFKWSVVQKNSEVERREGENSEENVPIKVDWK